MLIVLAVVASIILVIVILKYPMVSLGLFLTISLVKGTLMLKFGFFRVVDATVLCAVLVLIAMTYSFVKSGGKMKDILSFPLLLFLLLVVILLLGITYTSAPNYGFQKGTRFATLTFIAFLAPFFFVQSPKDIKLMIWIILVVGIILAVGTLIAPHAAVLRVPTRGGFLEAGALGTAIKIGTAAIVAFIFAITAHTSSRLRIIGLVVIPLMMVAIILTQSRMPFVGVVFTWLVALFICRKGVSKGWAPLITIAILIAMVVPLIKLPARVTARMLGMWRSGYVMKELGRDRTEPFIWVINRFGERPILGHGTGAYGVDRGAGDIRYFPHNIFMELLYEQGLVGVVIISLFLWLIFKRWRQASRFVHLYGLDIEIFEVVHIVGLLFLFNFIQAMKGADLNDNRFMFFFAGLMVVTFNQVRHMAEEISLENELITEEEQYLEEFEFQDTQVLY